MAIKIIIDEPSLGLTDQTGRLSYNSSGQLFDLIRGQRGAASIPFQLVPGDSYAPTVGSPIYIHEVVNTVDHIVWAGKILTVERTWVSNLGLHLDILTCTSLEACFDEIRIPPCAYFGRTAKYIFEDLFNRLCGGVPVTLGTVATGPTIPSMVFRWERISDAYDTLVTLSTGSVLIWGVQMTDQTLYLQPISTTPAPFVLAQYLLETGDWKSDQTDFRNRQLIQISFTAFSTSNEMFDGDSVSQQLSLRTPVDRVVSAMLTTGVQATAVGEFGIPTSPFFPVNPAPGDTFTITAPHYPAVVEDPYTFVTALDNTLRNQILIGAHAHDTCQNTVDAINAKPSQAGITYSLPTWENDSCNADQPLGGSPADTKFTLRVKNPGSGGNGVVLTATHVTSPGSFHWLSGVTADGQDGVTNALQVSVSGANTLSTDVQYTPGSAVISFSAPIPAGTSLSVAYYRLGGDTIALEDSTSVATRAAAEHGSGKYQQLITDTQNADAKQGYIKCYEALAAYKTIPSSFGFTLDQPLLSPGQLLTIAIVAPTGAPTLLDGTWLVQEVRASLIPGMERLPEPHGHLRYAVIVINTLQIADYIVFWENLAIVSPAGAQTVTNINTQTATPSLGTPVTPGTTPTGAPTTGTPTTSAGQQWAQEAPGRLVQKKNNDLLVDGSDNTIVSAVFTHVFVSGDVGKTVIVITGTGWTPGEYTIVSVSGGAAKLSGSPAAVTTAGGVWCLVSWDLFCTTWIPTTSTYTLTPILILTKNGKQLDPFVPGSVGFSALGGDYSIVGGNRIQFSVGATPISSDNLVATYFPDGIVPAAVGPAATRTAVFIDVVAADYPQAYTPHAPPGGDRHFFDVVTPGGIQEVVSTVSASGTTDLGTVWSLVSSDGHSTVGIGTLTPSPNSGARKLYNAPAQLPSTLPTPLPNVVLLGVQAHADSTVKAYCTITLTAAPTPPPPGQNFVAISNASSTTQQFMTSSAAISWTARTSAIDTTGGYAIASNGSGTIAALGFDNGSVLFVAMKSTDHGATWTSHTLTQPTGGYQDLLFAGGLFVGLGSVGEVVTSSDGSTWTLSATLPTVATNQWNALAFGAGVYVAVGNASSVGVGTDLMATSPDAATWTTQNSPFGTGLQTWHAVCFGGGQFVATGFFGGFGPVTGWNVATSPDGVTWTGQTGLSNQNWNGIAYGAGLYVAVQSDGITSNNVATSPDGVAWTLHTVVDAATCNRIRFVDSLFVICVTSPTSSGQTILTSPDGLTWTTQSTALADSVWDVTFG